MKYDLSKQLSAQQASELIREIVETGTIILSGHAKKRMEDRSYTMGDISFILTHGRVRLSEPDEITKNWKYRFEGEDLDGEQGAVVIAFEYYYQAIVITVLG